MPDLYGKLASFEVLSKLVSALKIRGEIFQFKLISKDAIVMNEAGGKGKNPS